MFSRPTIIAAAVALCGGAYYANAQGSFPAMCGTVKPDPNNPNGPEVFTKCSGDDCAQWYIYDTNLAGANCPSYAKFFGVMGATSAMIFSALGAAYGTAKSGTGIAAMAVMAPELIMKSIIPVVMAGIIAIYGLVVAVLIATGLTPASAGPTGYTLNRGFADLGAGLSVGISGLAAGFAIGIVGDSGVRGIAIKNQLFVGMILILIFAEVLGLYGLIIALIVSTGSTSDNKCYVECWDPCGAKSCTSA